MTHIHEKIDFTVEVFVVYNNKVLLRKHDKYKIWLSVGGHIELDEEPNKAAIREVKEEVGLDIQLFNSNKINLIKIEGYKELIPPEFLNIHKINENHKHIALTYFASTKINKLVLSKDEESEECRWFTKEEIDEEKYNIKDSIKIYAKKALESIKKN